MRRVEIPLQERLIEIIYSFVSYKYNDKIARKLRNFIWHLLNYLVPLFGIGIVIGLYYFLLGFKYEPTPSNKETFFLILIGEIILAIILITPLLKFNDSLVIEAKVLKKILKIGGKVFELWSIPREAVKNLVLKKDERPIFGGYHDPSKVGIYYPNSKVSIYYLNLILKGKSSEDKKIVPLLAFDTSKLQAIFISKDLANILNLELKDELTGKTVTPEDTSLPLTLDPSLKPISWNEMEKELEKLASETGWKIILNSDKEEIIILTPRDPEREYYLSYPFILIALSIVILPIVYLILTAVLPLDINNTIVITAILTIFFLIFAAILWFVWAKVVPKLWILQLTPESVKLIKLNHLNEKKLEGELPINSLRIDFYEKGNFYRREAKIKTIVFLGIDSQGTLKILPLTHLNPEKSPILTRILKTYLSYLIGKTRI